MRGQTMPGGPGQDRSLLPQVQKAGPGESRTGKVCERQNQKKRVMTGRPSPFHPSIFEVGMLVFRQLKKFNPGFSFDVTQDSSKCITS